MTSVYRTMEPSAFSLYILNRQTLSATDFILESDGLGFQNPKQASAALEVFAANPKLNKQFNQFYLEAKRQYDKEFDGDAHLLLQANAMFLTIAANRDLFPPDEIIFRRKFGADEVIFAAFELAGKYFTLDRQKFVAEFEKNADEARKLKEAGAAVPAQSAKKASDTLLAIIVEQQKAQDEPDCDPMRVLLKGIMDDEKAGSDGSITTESSELSLADKASVQAIVKILVKGEAADLNAVIKAYAGHS